jgi:hypothetical protein
VELPDDLTLILSVLLEIRASVQAILELLEEEEDGDEKETKRKVREHLLAIDARLAELISLLEARIAARKQAQLRREAS